MSLIYKNQDLFLFENLNAVAHGCNCAGAMGAGIAVPFRLKYPEMYKEYKQHCSDFGNQLLGTVFPWKDPKTNLVVYNMFTQGTNNSKNRIALATLESISSCFDATVHHALENNIKTIGIPKVGAGLGGLKWGDVEQTILPFCDLGIDFIVHYL